MYGQPPPPQFVVVVLGMQFGPFEAEDVETLAETVYAGTGQVIEFAQIA